MTNVQALSAAFSSMGVSRPIRFTFDCMEMAEREIKRAFRSKGSKAERAAFRLLMPTEPLIGKTIDLYTCHARELIQRLKRGEDTRPATDAELLALFCDTSLKAPLHRNAQAATEILWARCFPNAEIEGLNVDSETWPGGAREEIEKARRKARREERR